MPRMFESMRHILCFENNGSIVTVPIPTGGYYLSPQTCALSIARNVVNNHTITISPNPANQYSKITFPHTIQSGRLTITDVLGKTICNKTINNKPEIAIGELPASGFYFYQLTDLTPVSYTHLDVYKRQAQACIGKQIADTTFNIYPAIYTCSTCVRTYFIEILFLFQQMKSQRLQHTPTLVEGCLLYTSRCV